MNRAINEHERTCPDCRAAIRGQPLPSSVRREARVALTKAGREWHRAEAHAGTYDHCQDRTCYHTHPAMLA